MSPALQLEPNLFGRFARLRPLLPAVVVFVAPLLAPLELVPELLEARVPLPPELDPLPLLLAVPDDPLLLPEELVPLEPLPLLLPEPDELAPLELAPELLAPLELASLLFANCSLLFFALVSNPPRLASAAAPTAV